MQAIIPTIKPGEADPQVANLQDVLNLLLERGLIRALDPPNSPTADELAKLTELLANERGVYGDATQRLVRIVQIQQKLGDALNGVVEEKTAAVLNAFLKKLGQLDPPNVDGFVVTGRVTHSGGAPAPGLMVRARDRDLRTFQSLGDQAVTDADGHYEIHYSSEQFASAEDGTADLVIRVFSADAGADPDRPLVESPTMFNAPPVAEIDLTIADGSLASVEFERHMQAITPLLAAQDDGGGDLPLGKLSDADVDFLAGDTGIDRTHVVWLATASAFADRAPGVSAELFYGWFREGEPDQWEQLVTESIGALRTSATAAIRDQIISGALGDGLEASLAAMANPGRDSLRSAVTLAGLGDQAVATLLEHAGAVAEIDNPLVAQMVDQGRLSTAEGHQLGLALTAHDVVDGDESALTALLQAAPLRRPVDSPGRASDLAALDAPAIEQALTAAHAVPPGGMAVGDYAVQLEGRIAERFPTEALLHRSSTVSDDVAASLTRVVGGGAGNGSRIAGEPPLQELVNLHPGLGLRALIDGAADAGDALKTITERVAWIDRVRELNPDLDLLAVDYLPESQSLEQVNFGDLASDAQSMVAADLKVFQRIGLGTGALDGVALLKAGYRSATALAAGAPEDVAERTGVSLARVIDHQDWAETRATDAALTWFAFHDLERARQVTQNRSLPLPPAYLAKLAGYAEAFGTPTFCRCAHCQSVLGPAAYFVDLMSFVERHILQPSFKKVGGEEYDLHLRKRRPDLWTLELTCANTNDVVPTLDLVNALLEAFIVKAKGLASADLLYARLATVDHSLRLPFDLGFEQLSLWLSHLGLRRSEIADTLLLNADAAPVRARIRLDMLPMQFQIVTTSRLGDLSAARIQAAEAYYDRVLGANLTLSTIPGQTETRALDPINVLSFARAAACDTDTAKEILTSNFVNGSAAGAPARIELESGIATPGGVQNDVEQVRNLTSGRLDRFERFERLWRHLTWTATELDYVLGRVPAAVGGAPPAIDEAALIALAQLVSVQDQLNVSVEELCALWDELPSVPLSGDTSLLHRLFDPEPDPSLLVTPDLRGPLAAALHIGDADLTILIDGLETCLGRIDTDAAGHQTFVAGLWANKRNLSLLFRHARLARLLNLSVADLLATVGLTAAISSKPAAEQRCVLTLEDLTAVLEVHRWRVASGFSLRDIALITGRAVSGGEDPDALAAEIAAAVTADKSLEVSPTLFTQLAMTQSEAARVVADNYRPVGGNPPLLEPVPGGDAFRIRRIAGAGDVDTWFRFDPEPRPALVAEVAQDVLTIAVRNGQGGFEPADLESLGLSNAEALALVAANLSTAAADTLPFEPVPGAATHYQLRATIKESDAVAGFGDTAANVESARAILVFRAREIVTRSYPEIARDVYLIVRQAGDAGFEPAALTTLGLTQAEADAWVAANLSAGAGDDAPFEHVATAPGAPSRYRLRAAVSEAAAIASFGTTSQDFPATKSILRHRGVDLLLRHHAAGVLATRASAATGLTPERTTALLGLALPTDAADRASLVDALQGGPLPILSTVLARLIRFSVLFRGAAYDQEALAFVAANPGVLALTDPPTADTVRRVSLYAALATATDPAFQPDAPSADVSALQSVLMWPDSIAGARSAPGDTAETQAAKAVLRQQLASALKSDARQIDATLSQLTFAAGLPVPRIDELTQLARALALIARVGAAPAVVRLSVSEDSQELARGADGVLAAIRAQYADEDSFHANLEPFDDKLRSRRRDGLVEYLLSAPDDALTDWRRRFANANDLYHHFLTDVMVEGCARTSKVVAATASVQLYVHRVLMNLEQAEGPPAVAAHFDTAARQDQWAWRKNYQVWVANRKVFLYPETYLEPGLRDDKTPLFKDLEDTLLRQEISDSTVEDAYAQYVLGFDELSGLEAAGACYDPSAKALHLFAVTHHQPPRFFYRRVDNAASDGPIASSWQPLSLSIPVRHVSPVLFDGRLYIFWMETTTRPESTFSGGDSVFKGYRHAVRIRYSVLRADDAWTAPQSLRFTTAGATEEARIIFDPVLTVDQNRLKALQAQVGALTQLASDADIAANAAQGKVDGDMRDLGTASAALKAQLTPGEVAQELGVAAGAEVARAAAIGFAFFLGPFGAAAAGEQARELVIAAAAGVSPAELNAVGLGLTDGYITLQRKVDVYRAAVKLQLDQSMHGILAVAAANIHAALTNAQAALDGVVVMVKWDKSGRDHSQPLDNYAPEGWQWERVYPDVHTGPDGSSTLRIVLAPTNDDIPGQPQRTNWSDEVDVLAGILRPVADNPTGTDGALRLNNSAGRITRVWTSDGNFAGQEFFLASKFLNEPATPGTDIARAPAKATVQVVNGDPTSVVIESGGDTIWMRDHGGGSYAGTRLSTTLTPRLTAALGNTGVTGLLDPGGQMKLTEIPSTITPVSGQDKLDRQSPFYKNAACLTYFRETFFQIPFLIADHFNAQQRFAESQRWYHSVFDPTAADGVAWRYREFRDLSRTAQSLRDTLTDPLALDSYRKDPFNPHAIARVRPGAYEKAIVMKYIDNLLDWGDSLYAQFTMESVNQATMLYIMAADVLGPRPVNVGACGELAASPQTYEHIAPFLQPADPNDPDSDSTAEVLIEEIETFTVVRPDLTTVPVFVAVSAKKGAVMAMASAAQPRQMARMNMAGMPMAAIQMGGIPVGGMAGDGMAGDGPFGLGPGPVGGDKVGAQSWQALDATPLADLSTGVPIGGASVHTTGRQGQPALVFSGDPVGPPEPGPSLGGALDSLDPRHFGQLSGLKGLQPADYTIDVKYGLRDQPIPLKAPDSRRHPNVKPAELVRAQLVFCIPENEELGAYWDKVDNRLYNIRNCMDIAGVRRRLELFAPEIDPHMLVRMRAAGLSLDDVMNVTSGNLPPYRFTYLIEKAKQYAGLVQSFGGQVLSALEKRDGEELTRLRTVHEQNLLQLRHRSTQLEIDAAQDALAGLQSQRAAAQYRQQYFTTLSATGLLAAESKQQQFQREAGGYRTMAGLAQVISSILSIIPDMGAPTAMKFGGSQLGAAGRSVAEGFSALAAYDDTQASMAGAEASNRRRDQDWTHQVETAKRDVAQIDAQIAAAQIRRDIALEAQTIHERSTAQTEEIFDLLRDRFTSFGRFTWLSGELQKLHRMAFNSALSLARLAEQAYRFERPDQAPQTGLTGNYWDAGNSGLLAGDRLMLDLHELERAYLETNDRKHEIEQSFSLARFAPDALWKLKSDQACEFEIPEWYFDLTYPDHYRRRIKAVRLTIPCVVGPHTNVGATLRLIDSHVRTEPTLLSAVPVPPRHTTSVATSLAQSDAGVFEFSFRDERYMPFEGAGVNSRWQLTLPAKVKPFDYSTISDVILRISYTAEEDSGLRQAVEASTGVLADLASQGVTRMLSIRNDFPGAWNSLLEGNPTTLAIAEVHMPFFISAFQLDAVQFDILVAKQDANPYPIVTSDTDAAIVPGPDEESGLYRLARTKTATPFVGDHPIALSGLVDAGVTDVVLRAVLKKTTP